MDATDLRLDGNAVAGLLGEVFAAEMTSALETCDGCGATHALGAVHRFLERRTTNPFPIYVTARSHVACLTNIVLRGAA